MVSKKIDHGSGGIFLIAQQGDAAALEGITRATEDTMAPTVLLSIERRW